MNSCVVPWCLLPMKKHVLFSLSSFFVTRRVNIFAFRRCRYGLSLAVKYPAFAKCPFPKCNSHVFAVGISKRISFLTGNCNCYARWSRCIPSHVLSQNYEEQHRWKSMQNVTSTVRSRSSRLQETRAKLSEKMEELNENVVTIPNALCVMRIAVTPLLGYLVLQEFYSTSFGIFLFAGCTDVVDGYIARTFPAQQSMIGSFLDPAADKLLIATLFLSLTAKGLIPVPLTLLIICRDVCLMAAGFYVRYVSLPPPKTLARYFDVSFVTARLSPTRISKINTGVQLSLVALSLAAPVFGYVDHILLHYLWYTTAATTIISAGSYMFSKNTYKLIAATSKKPKS